MASIQHRKKMDGSPSYYISYRYKNDSGVSFQKTHHCDSLDQAKSLLPLVQKAEKEGHIFIPDGSLQLSMPSEDEKMTVQELINRYLDNQAAEWAPSTLTGHTGLAKNYIYPYIGEWDVAKVKPRDVQAYYSQLLKASAVPRNGQKHSKDKVSARTIVEIKKILSPAFAEQVEQGFIPSNPFAVVHTPKVRAKTRARWQEEDIKAALDAARNDGNIQMQAAIMTQYTCTTRSGELLGLTWEDITEKDGFPCININKTLERCQRAALKQTLGSDIYKSFPAQKAGAKTVVVLKNPKTDESKRYVYINDILLDVLKSLKAQQAHFKELLGPDYHDYRLIFSLENGDPMTSGVMSKRFHRFCKKHGLKDVDMYSLRHSGCMAKLIAANGNLKAVQGDMGHSTSQMVLKIYSEIRDEDRKRMAEEMARRMQEQLITK